MMKNIKNVLILSNQEEIVQYNNVKCFAIDCQCINKEIMELNSTSFQQFLTHNINTMNYSNINTIL